MAGKKPNPIFLTVDVIVFALTPQKTGLEVLLIKRLNPPFKGMWAIPGGFVDLPEDVPDAALRELEEETSVKNIEIEELGVFGKPGRDPRGRTVSAVYVALVDRNKVKPKAGDDAREVAWFSIRKLPKLGFDHSEILEAAIKYIKNGPKKSAINKQYLKAKGKKGKDE